MSLLTRILGPVVRQELTALNKSTHISPTSPTLKKMFGWGETDDLTDAFSQLPIVYAAVKAVGKVLSQTRLMILRGEREVGPNDPVARLFDNPNRFQSPYEFKDAIGTNVQTKGNAFIVKDEKEVRGLPIEITVWPSRYFTPKYGDNGDWIGWMVKRGKADPFFMPPERVVHLTSGYNPNDELIGMAPLDVLKMTYKSMWDAIVYNKKFFENDGTPPIIYKAANILPEAYREAFKKDAIERRKGKSHAHEAQLIEGMDVTTLGFTQKDIQFLELLKHNEEEVLMVFGVTKTQVSKYEDVNYATALSQDKIFISNTVLPLMRQIESEINSQWLEALGYTVQFDERSNAAMTYVAGDEANKVVNVARAGLITINEAREMMGMEAVEWGEEPPQTMASPFTAEPMQYAEQPRREEPKPPAEELETKGIMDDAFAKARRTNTWHSLNNKVVPIQKRCAGAVRRYFFEIERRLLNMAKDFQPEVVKNVADPDVDAVFDDEELERTVRTYLEQAISVGYTTMGIGTVNIEDPGIVRYLSSRASFMRGINDTAKEDFKKKLHEVLAQALEDKLTEAQRAEAIRSLIKEQFAGLKSHARTIARTEVHGAFADGRWQACEELSPTEIEWVSSRDALVRDSHAHLDGKRVPFGERFENGCRYPLDPIGEPGETINCRCTYSTHF